MRPALIFIGLFCALFLSPLHGVVRILTFHYNQPSFIELQHRCLKRFLLDPYELIVFNDASTADNEKAIQETCDRLAIKCVRFEPQWHFSDPLNLRIQDWLEDPSLQDPAFLHLPLEALANQPSVRHSHVIQYALDNYGYDHNDAVVIMDGDAFFIRKISIKSQLKKAPIIGMTRKVKEKDVSYLWVPFVAFDPISLPQVRDLQFNVSRINNKIHDTGAQSYYYLANHPEVNCLKTLPLASHALNRRSDKELKQAGYRKREIHLIRALPRKSSVEFNIENGVLHFREVSFLKKGHAQKADCLMQFMEKILKKKALISDSQL